MSVDTATVARIAALARIKVSEAELEAMVPELNGILAWVEQLGEVDVTGVEPMTAVIENHLRLRDDVIGAVHFFREALRHNPDRSAYHFALGQALATNPRWYKEAEKHLLEASRSEPLNNQIFLLLGQIYRDSGLTKRAEAQYRQILGMDPRNAAARQALVDMGLESPAGKSGGGSGLLGKIFRKK